MRKWGRVATAALLLGVSIATGVVSTGAPAYANQNSLWFNQIGQTTGSYGANAVVRIWGDLSFKNEGCPEDGVPDFVYATSDVYIVAAGTGTGTLSDISGGSPNTVIQYGSVFDDEIIGITAPGGSLAAGTYDVVFDTCQDGQFQPEDDKVFPGVLTVALPAQLPAADAALSTLKQKAHEEYVSWRNTRRVMDEVWKLVQKALKNGCKAGNPTACALKYGNYFSPIQEQFNGLLLNQGQHYLAIYEDPPNPDFDQPVVAEPVTAPDAIAGEGAVLRALLASIEAYKGAQQAGDSRWALVHAREARDLHAALTARLDATTAQLTDLKSRYGADADAALQFGTGFLGRVWQQGLNPDERRTLRENGLTVAQVTDLETDIRRARMPEYRAADVTGVLASVIAAHTATRTAADEGYAAWAAIVDALEGDASVPDEHPVAQAGGPYTATEGSPVTLDASGSTAVDGATITAYGWDLDGDRDFDDAAGAAPAVVFADPGAPLIGLRTTDSAGRTAYAWTTATVAAHGTGPQISTASPDGFLRTVPTGTGATFSVTVTDDAGTPVVAWTVDGAAAGTGTSLGWVGPGQQGTHEIVATVTDTDGHQAVRAWDVLVHKPDADGDGWTAATDCNDGDAAVHPGQLEFLGNGVDDDCDPGSPDAPPGGLTGQVYGWGEGSYGKLGDGKLGTAYTKPVKSTMLAPNVVQVELGDATGYAVLADGTVRAWGYQHSGEMGDGTLDQRLQPVQPLGPGGQGVLSGVRQLSAGADHVAVTRTDGKVLTWGRNTAGILGDGSTANSRPYPDFVRTAAGGDPLTGVRSVETGFSADYALMDDGTVMAWGRVNCDGSGAAVDTLYPAPIPGLSGVRQIAVSSAIVLFLKTDGTVLSCGGTDPQLGRAWNLTDPAKSPWLPRQVDTLGRGSKVVDLSISTDQAVVLKEDGSVFFWGQNTNGGLGPVLGANTGELLAPTAVPLPAGPPVVGVDNGNSPTTLTIRADGSMLVWGGNTYGGAGTGTNGFVLTPTVVPVGDQAVVQVSASSWNGLALTRPKNDPDLELPAGWVKARVEDAALTEAGDGAFTVRLDHALSDDVSLTWSLEAGTAGADDAALGTGTVTIPAGATQAAIAVDVTDDALDEDDETLTLALTGARLGLVVDRAQAAGTIADDDAAPTVSVQPVTVAEGGTSLTDLPVRLRLSGPSGKEISVGYATADGTARDGEDYVGAAATARFAPGQTEHVVHLAVRGDSLPEPDESFTVSLGETVDAVAGSGATVTITDDEVFTVSVSAPTLVEGQTGTFVVTVSPAPVPGTSVTVPWTVYEPSAGAADSPGDVAAAGGELHLSADQPSAAVTVTAVDDSAVESPEPFSLRLGALSATDGHAVRAGEQGTAWITDDDRANQPPTVDAGAGVTAVEGSPVTLTGTVSDDRAGVGAVWTVDGPCTVTGTGPQASVLCADQGTFIATLTATDGDGAVAADTTTVDVANAAPVIATVALDASGARVDFADAGVNDQHTCTVRWGDGTQPGVLSGAVSPCYLAHAYPRGTFTATITVADGDGGSVSTTRSVTVGTAPWPFRGFKAPIDNPPAVNVVNAGQAIPVKFSLGGYRGMDIFAAGSPASGRVNCCHGQLDVIEQTVTAGGSTLTYDAAKDQYTYVWKTDKAWAGQCRRLIVTLADGTQHWAEFRFR
ncbi:hypothetical protein Cs7R123_50000 [Catellatospora sp. TT07R-123]|uniref:PxKF domain-containing protein n=1 Tax=Catellatospora sp. TT07R-123 TaxID=2733863 RepID=UPI001B105B37|nr:PxKF domain-containing protein [Catellatospora sp. TT07R-123]GHJ47658.1 hypothetical protein Cs7R123_50000 [Catellatospora sp. TT07R-123]